MGYRVYKKNQDALKASIDRMALKHMQVYGVRPENKSNRDINSTKLMDLIGKLCRTKNQSLGSLRSELIHSGRRGRKILPLYGLNDLV